MDPKHKAQQSAERAYAVARQLYRMTEVLGGRPPTLAEMAQEMGVSPSTVQRRLVNAHNLGLVSFSRSHSWAKWYLSDEGVAKLRAHYGEGNV